MNSIVKLKNISKKDERDFVTRIARLLPFLTCMILFSCASSRHARLAREIAKNEILIDTHIDVPYRLNKKWDDISKRTADGNFDYPRAMEGGLDAPFMSIYVPAKLESTGRAKKIADALIDTVERIVRDHPDQFILATSPFQIRDASTDGKLRLCLGMENGSPIEGSFDNLKHFYDRGIRYITLTHGKDNHISDSSYDTTRTWKGLSPFGMGLVLEMNRLGIMVDVSHISDSAFYQVMRISRAPVIASHSSCRAFTPGWERNMSDDMIRRLASRGGVIMINFGSSFVNDEYRQRDRALRDEVEEHARAGGFADDDSLLDRYEDEFRKSHPIGYADIDDVVRHIDHVVQLVGVDHVGLGSDFDGLGDSLPTGLKDVSQYPNLIERLLQRGYSRDDIKKICGGNLLRVWSNVEKLAAR